MDEDVAADDGIVETGRAMGVDVDLFEGDVVVAGGLDAFAGDFEGVAVDI